MNKVILGLILFCFSSYSFSAHLIDVYGAEEQHAKQILHKYSQQIIQLDEALNKYRIGSNLTETNNTQQLENLETKKKRLEQKIQNEEGLLFVYFHTTLYPTEDNLYTTIEVIEKTNPERLIFVDTDEPTQKTYKHFDLIEKMQEYMALGNKLGNHHQLNTKNIPCPVYHCVFGFEHPQLKTYLNTFNEGVIKERTKILNVLNHDPDPQRRAAAAFLIGHFKNAEEIISILSKHVNDPHSLIRNNVIRVISYTIEKAHINYINIGPFLNLLNSPYGTDRNKALAVLVSASSEETSRLLIINKAQKHLLALLQLKQPNNHEWAYLLLKKISGENYGAQDIAAWEQWFASRH